MIAFRSIRIAAYVYVLGSLLAVFTIRLGANRFTVSYGMVLALAIAEIVSYTAGVVSYRRGI